MKKRNLVLIIVVILVIIVGVVIINSRKNTNRQYEGEFQKITLTTGSSSVGSSYIIEQNGTINFRYFNGGKSKEKEVKISENKYSKILEIVNKYNIDSWNGYDEDDDSDGGYTFSLKIEYKNGNEINAHGINSFPSEYGKFEEEMQKYLDNISGMSADKIR